MNLIPQKHFAIQMFYHYKIHVDVFWLLVNKKVDLSMDLEMSWMPLSTAN